LKDCTDQEQFSDRMHLCKIQPLIDTFYYELQGSIIGSIRGVGSEMHNEAANAY